MPKDRVIKLVKKFWRDKVSPFGVLRKLGPLGARSLIKRTVGRRMPGLPDEEKKALGEYLPQVLMRPGSTEYTLFILFQPFMKAHMGLCHDDLLPQLEIPVAFMYGDEDWMRMDMQGAIIAKEKRDKAGLQTEIYELDNCGHHLYMENPEQMVEKIRYELRTITGDEVQLTHGGLLTEEASIKALENQEEYLEQYLEEEHAGESPEKEAPQSQPEEGQVLKQEN